MSADVQAALDMLDAFASVGAGWFDITFTDAAGQKIGFRGNRTLGQLRSGMPAILEEAAERQHNVIVRPRAAGAALIQLDDLGEESALRLRPASFLVLRTSPGSYQAWVAVADADADFARRLRRGAGADVSASGATRLSGSLNFKERHAPAYPRVETVHANPGLVATQAVLEALGVVAPPEVIAPPPVRTALRQPGARRWPSYQRCVDNAPEASEGGRPDISRADFTFCLLSLDWGWSVEETIDRLMQESGKAREEGERYASRTAEAAARVIERRGKRTEHPFPNPALDPSRWLRYRRAMTDDPTPDQPDAKPARKPRKPRAPRKKAAAPTIDAAPQALDTSPVTGGQESGGPNIAAPEAAVSARAATGQPDSAPAVPAQAVAEERAAIQNETHRAPIATPPVNADQLIELKGAKPRSSGRRAWDINLGGPGQTWERVTTPSGEEVIFRFKDRPDNRQMELIGKYGFTYDENAKEAYRANDLAGRAYADKLAWYLRELQRGQGASVAV